MSNELLMSRRDLAFQLYEWLDVGSLTQSARYADHGRETYDAVLDACERLAVEKFAPHYQKADRIEPQFDGERVTVIDEIGPALKAFAEAGLPAATQDYARGGMQLPTVIEKAAWSYLCAANISRARSQHAGHARQLVLTRTPSLHTRQLTFPRSLHGPRFQR